MRLRHVSALLAVSAILLSAAPAAAMSRNFIAVINPGQEMPPVSEFSMGNAFMTYDTKTAMLCFSISYLNLSSAEVAAHFHGPGSPGVNAAILFGLPSGTPKTGCVGPLDTAQRRALLEGRFYINIHTAIHPDGELRGQVIPVKGK